MIGDQWSPENHKLTEFKSASKNASYLTDDGEASVSFKIIVQQVLILDVLKNALT